MTFEELLNETKKHVNELVISPDLSISRLVGLYDGEDDYYYIIHHPYGNKHPVTYMSAVSGMIYLKGAISDEEYSYLDSTFELNGCLKTDDFIIKLD